MASITVNDIPDGTTAEAADVNTNINTIVDEINGGLDNANIAADAAIDTAKLAGGNSGMFGAWQNFTPTVAGTTVGDGTLFAKYRQMGKRLEGVIQIVAGSTTNLANNTTFTLPFDLNEDTTTGYVCGTAYARNVGVDSYHGWVVVSPASDMLTINWQTASAATSTVFPFADGSGDHLSVQFVVELA